MRGKENTRKGDAAGCPVLGRERTGKKNSKSGINARRKKNWYSSLRHPEREQELPYEA
jgi:hypothetical protein